MSKSFVALNADFAEWSARLGCNQGRTRSRCLGWASISLLLACLKHHLGLLSPRRSPISAFWGYLSEKSDPGFTVRRKPNMLTQILDTPYADQRPRLPPSRERTTVSQSKIEISQQTQWMIAVRDNRDRSAFSALFDHFAPRLKGFIIRSGASAHQAEEIVQDVMLTVWRKAAQFDPHRAQVSAWIYQIARNRQIDLARKENRPMPEELKEEPGAAPDASQILGLEQESTQLRRALSGLKIEQREIIEQAYIGELTHKEISAQTGLPLGTIKSRIRLGLERLRHELKDRKQ